MFNFKKAINFIVTPWTDIKPVNYNECQCGSLGGCRIHAVSEEHYHHFYQQRLDHESKKEETK